MDPYSPMVATPTADQIAAALATVPQSIGEFTVATLPAPALTPDKFAFVSDLYSAVRDKVFSIKIGTTWYWVPSRSFTKTNVPIGNATLGALTTPTTTLFNGTLLSAAEVKLSPLLAYPGARIDIGFDGTISLGTITISGLVGNATTALGANGRKTFVYADNNDGTFGWRAY